MFLSQSFSRLRRRTLRRAAPSTFLHLAILVQVTLSTTNHQRTDAAYAPAAASRSHLPFRMFRHSVPSQSPPYLLRHSFSGELPLRQDADRLVAAQNANDLLQLARLYQPAQNGPDLTVKKRSKTYVQLRCGGIYDQQMFAKLEQVCDDCFNLYKEPQVHGMCR